MADVDKLQDNGDVGATDAASTTLVAEWLGYSTPAHNPSSDVVPPKPGDATVSAPSNSDANLDSERTKLKAQAEQSISNPQEHAKFEADMVKFEQRAAKNNPPVSADEVAKTYKEVNRLLTAKDNPDSPLRVEDRRKLAEQVMSQAADPTIIKPLPDTCPESGVEKALYIKHPADAAKAVVDVATTGKYTTPDGTVVSIDKESISAHGDAKNNPPLDGQRSHASQIFQVAASNALVAKYGLSSKLIFEQREPTGSSDTGERYIDKSDPLHPKVVSGFGVSELDTEETAQLATIMSGKNDITVLRPPDVGDAMKESSVMNKQFKSESELKTFLADAKHNGKLPAIMAVNSGAGLLGYTERSNDAHHFVVVLDYDEKTGKALIDTNDPLTKEHTVAIDAGDLYHKSTEISAADAIKDLEQQIAQDQKTGVIDTAKELELLKLQAVNSNHYMSNDDFAKQYEQILDRATQNWDKQRQEGTFNQAEHDYIAQKAVDSGSTELINAAGIKILQAQHEAGIISDTDYANLVYKDIRDGADEIRQNIKEGDQDFANEIVKDFKAVLTPAEQQYLDKLLKEPLT